jgi:hypothetical protein
MRVRTPVYYGGFARTSQDSAHRVVEEYNPSSNSSESALASEDNYIHARWTPQGAPLKTPRALYYVQPNYQYGSMFPVDH